MPFFYVNNNLVHFSAIIVDVILSKFAVVLSQWLKFKVAYEKFEIISVKVNNAT